jgi:hypothetical protein
MKEIRLSELFPGVDFSSRDFTPEELAVVYRAAREAFSAEDLQRYTELDEGYSAEEFLRELEQTQKQYDTRTE